MDAALGPIATQAAKVRRKLQDLSLEVARRGQREAGSDSLPHGVDIDADYLADCLVRFNVWVASIGVFQKGDASLDFRLSNEDLTREILRLLRQLGSLIGERTCAFAFAVMVYRSGIRAERDR